MLFQTIRHYKAWRSFDTSLMILSKMIPCQAKISVPPAKLVKIFGPPSWHDNIQGTSGTYEFEDMNLDQFRVFDRFQTKEFIKPRLLKLKHPPYSHRGKNENMLTAAEFWKSHADAEFWVAHSHYADKESFLKWLKEKIEKNEDKYKQMVEKYGETEAYNDYNKQYTLSREYALFKHNKIKWD